jgi:hypothetical protein
MPLGRVLGLLLDRHASTEPGQATLVHESDEDGVEQVRLFWHSASVWRMETQHGGVISDGVQVQEWQGSRRHPPRPARKSWPGWHFQLVFPLRAHVFGRLGDDYFPTQTRLHQDAVLVELAGMEDDRTGHLLVDRDDGFIREASFLGGRRTLRLDDLHQGPLDQDASFFSVRA